ncbi:MAG TPA: ATP-binding protein [bacterium]|nr:ATP-binding protein [bacterium]
MIKTYLRKKQFEALAKKLKRGPRFIQALIGPRQTGKTTLVLQLKKNWKGSAIYKTADAPGAENRNWIVEINDAAVKIAKETKKETLLIIDEIQKIPGWSNTLKYVYDKNEREQVRVRIIILGSSSLLMQRGLTESLAGRFEINRHSHWSFKECREFFKFTLNDYIYYGGYPGAAKIRKNEKRWQIYIKDAIIETVIAKDVLLMNPVTKPALLRQAFALCLHHPAEIFSYQKMLGQLQDAGNTTTIAFYLRLMANAFFLVPLDKFSGSRIKQKSSSPKILSLDNSIINVVNNRTFKESFRDLPYKGRLFENAVGSRLYWLAQEEGWELFYWRERNFEVDYVLSKGRRIIAVEVKSGYPGKAHVSFDVFAKRYKNAEKVVVSLKKGESLTDIKYLEAEQFFLNPEKIFS